MSRLQKDPRLLVGVVAGAVVLLLAASWLLLLSPKRDKVVELDQSIAAEPDGAGAEEGCAGAPLGGGEGSRERSLPAEQGTARQERHVSDHPRRQPAGGSEQALVQLDRARPPRSPAPGSIAQPVIVTVQGRFGSVSKFLGDLRTLVRVRGGLLDARGRTYSITQVDVGSPDEATFPMVKSTVTINAHSFIPTAPVDPNAATTTTPSSTGTVAAGVTP